MILLQGIKEKVSITQRCTELDKAMPDMLGVPRPVLEHVVFCEEAAGPTRIVSCASKQAARMHVLSQQSTQSTMTIMLCDTHPFNRPSRRCELAATGRLEAQGAV